jgi:hypothetical protein
MNLWASEGKALQEFDMQSDTWKFKHDITIEDFFLKKKIVRFCKGP